MPTLSLKPRDNKPDELEKNLKLINDYKKKLTQISRNLKTYSKKTSKNLESLRKNRKTLLRIEKLALILEDGVIRRGFNDWFDKEKKRLDLRELRIRSAFPEELYNSLSSSGLKLEGHVPNLKTGFYVIEVNFDNNQSRIFYGPDREPIKKIKIDPEKISEYIVKHRNTLEKSYENYDKFVFHLEKSYSNIIKKPDKTLDKKAPIIDVMYEMAKEKNQEETTLDPKKRTEKYGRIQFSYDIYRLLRGPSEKIRIKLSTATRAQARSRKNYLWIPKNERGDGAIFSHIEVVRE